MSKKSSILSILNNQSKPLQEKHQAEVRQLSVKQILPNEHNFYDTTNVEDLKASIELFGIKQPLLVKKIDIDKYKVIAGHRRLISARQLYEAGNQDFEHVPCIVETDTNSIKEKIMLIHTNSTTRELSDWEKIEQLSQLKELFTEFKKTHSVPGRIRDLLADTLQMSTTAIGRMETVDKNLVPEFKSELKQKNISMQTAVELSKLDEAKQQEALKQHKERGNKTQVKHIVEPVTPSPESVNPHPCESNLEPADVADTTNLFEDDFELRFLYREALSKTVSNYLDNRVKLCVENCKEEPSEYNQKKLRAYELVKKILEDEVKKI